MTRRKRRISEPSVNTAAVAAVKVNRRRNELIVRRNIKTRLSRRKAATTIRRKIRTINLTNGNAAKLNIVKARTIQASLKTETTQELPIKPISRLRTTCKRAFHTCKAWHLELFSPAGP